MHFSSIPIEELAELLTRAREVGLSAKACERLEWLLHYRKNGSSVAETCRHFGINRVTFYRLTHRFDSANLETLEDLPKLPHKYTVAPQTEQVACADGDCVFCKMKIFNWRGIKRALVLGSVLANIALIGMVLATAFLENRSTSERINASILPADQIETYTLIPHE